MAPLLDRIANRAGWLVPLAAIAYIGAHVYLDLLR